jgi:hypothetical protein
MNHPKLRTIEPHPENFPKVKRALEQFAQGTQSFTRFQRDLAAAGLVGVRSGKPLPLSSIGWMLRNPFYYGVFLHKGEMHQGVHVPMISKQTFDAIQRAIVAVGKPRNGNRKAEKGFRFMNFATCGSCGYAITGELKIKKSGLRFIYYRCTHKSKIQRCEDRKFTREDRLAAEIKRNVQLVTIPEEWKEWFLAKIETWEAEASQTRQDQIARLKAELDGIKSNIDRLNTAFADGAIDLAEFKEIKNPLVPRKTELEQKISALEKSTANRLEPLKNWIIEANQARKMGLD